MYNVMIVDDENKIRQGLTGLIDWSKLECQVVYSAKNGEDAIEHLEICKPQIILTDIRMPIVNGIELAKFIHEAELNIEVIILTGYADFEYSQKAIKYNVRDFILKPTRYEELEKSIKKAIGTIKERERIIELEQSAKSILSSSNEKNLELVLYKVINNISLDKKEKEVFNQLNRKGFRYYNCICIKLLLNISDITVNENYLLNYHRHIVKKCIHQVFKDSDYLVLFPSNDNVGIFYFDYTEGIEEQGGKNNTYCTEMMSILETFEDMDIKMGISRIYRDIKHMSQAYEESMAAIKRVFYAKEDDIFTFLEDTRLKIFGKSIDVEKSLTEVGEVMASGDINKIETYISNIFRVMKDKCLNPEAFRHYAFIILEFLAKIDPENVSSTRLQSYKQYHLKIMQSQSADEVSECVIALFNSIKISILDGSSHRLVNEANEYIKNNIDKNISLQDVAKSLHVNNSYLSRLYKKVTNKTLTVAITANKVEFAKTLLATTDLKIYDISREVGFEDAAYFSQIFRKYTGYNPSDYRNNNLHKIKE